MAAADALVQNRRRAISNHEDDSTTTTYMLRNLDVVF